MFIYFCFPEYGAVCAKKTATLLKGAQLSANRLYCCGITDNPGRFDSKSTQGIRVPRRTDGRRKRVIELKTSWWE